MAFEKEVISKISGYKIFNVDSEEELSKVANVKLPNGFEYDPDYLYLLVRIVSAGEYYGPNRNGDYFPASQLEKSYKTFANAHPFREHNNKDVSHSLGKIISVRWNEEMKTVEVLKAIDRKRSPALVRGYEKGYMTDVSMGCKVPYTVCSVCGNKAKKSSEFCDHINKYSNSFLPNGERVFEINYHPKFHDSSLVLNGAERAAKAVMILSKKEDFDDNSLFSKTASDDGKVYTYAPLSDQEIEKIAASKEQVHPILREDKIEKVATSSVLQEKLAAIEKELTGKVISVATAEKEPLLNKPAEDFIGIVKFLSEGRLTESAPDIGYTLMELADNSGVSRKKAFKAFLTVCDLVGINLYPSELAMISESMTYGGNPDFAISESIGHSLSIPDILSSRMSGYEEAIDSLPMIDSPEKLLTVYELAPMYKNVIVEKPDEFIRIVNSESAVEDDSLPLGFIEKIKMMIKPIIPNRSYKSPNLHARLLSSIDSGLRNPIKESEIDLTLMYHPQTIGDLLGSILYSNFRRQYKLGLISGSGMAKTAAFYDKDKMPNGGVLSEIFRKPHLDKTASVKPIEVSGSDIRNLVKIATPVETGAYRVFNDENMQRFANYTGYRDVQAIKVATLLEYGGLHKQANDVKNEYKLPEFAIDNLVRYAYDTTKTELWKAANDIRSALVVENFEENTLIKQAMDLSTKDDLVLRYISKYL